MFWEKFVKVWTNCENFIKNFMFQKFWKLFRKYFNNNLEKFNENLNILLLSIFIAET